MLGVVACLIALGASSSLALHHLGGIQLAGCGIGDACDKATKGPMGKVPGTNWPVSFMGVAVFLGFLAAWISFAGRAPSWFAWVVRVGFGISLVYIGIMFAFDALCLYCLATHAGNALFLIAVELARKAKAKSAAQSSVESNASARDKALPRATFALVTLIVVTLVSSIVLGVVESGVRAKANVIAEQERAQSLANMTRSTGASAGTSSGTSSGATQIVPPIQQQGAQPAPTPAPTTPLVANANPTPTPTATPAANPITDQAAVKIEPLTGRWRFGPESAKVRIVLFTSYQCPDCKIIEQELATLMASTPDISVGIRYFPLSNVCNPNVPNNPQPNSCWAARAAEAAGRLQGVNGFWKMHTWLFARSGSFTDAELNVGLKELGFEQQSFLRVMTGIEAQSMVTQDIDLAMYYGLRRTPMIFINGVELRGWTAPQALTRTVMEVLATDPLAFGPDNDIPPTAADKFFEDWRTAPLTTLPVSLTKRTVGPADALVKVMIIGDYQDKSTAEADAICRQFAKLPAGERTRDSLVIQYFFAPFPVDQSCNPSTQRTAYPKACSAVRAAEAADILGGSESFWAMHDWLMLNQTTYSVEALNAAAPGLGLDAAQLADAMQQGFVTDAIASQARAAMGIGLRSVPMIYVNGKLVGTWKVANENLLPRIFSAALAEELAKAK